MRRGADTILYRVVAGPGHRARGAPSAGGVRQLQSTSEALSLLPVRRPALLALLALSIAPLVRAALAQNEGTKPPFLTGMCTTPESDLGLDSLVARPERPPAIAPGFRMAPFPDSLRAPGYEGTVETAFVVDVDGAVRAGTVAVMSSTDPALSRWACDAVPAMRFVPAQDGGRPVATQILVPFSYRIPAQGGDRIYLELDVQKPVTVAYYLQPIYPRELRKDNVEGEVVVEFVVDTTGRAEMDTFKVLRSSNWAFTQSARAAVMGMRFHPAELLGHKVRQRVRQPFTFSLTREESPFPQPPSHD
jgi:TonB family protein